MIGDVIQHFQVGHRAGFVADLVRANSNIFHVTHADLHEIRQVIAVSALLLVFNIFKDSPDLVDSRGRSQEAYTVRAIIGHKQIRKKKVKK